MKTFGWFNNTQGAGWYTSAQVGAHEYVRVEMWFVSNDPDINKDELPAFAYWHDDTPICDSYLNS